MTGPSWLNRPPYNRSSRIPPLSRFLEMKEEAEKAIAFAEANCHLGGALLQCVNEVRELLSAADRHLSSPETSAIPCPQSAQLVEAIKGMAILIRAHKKLEDRDPRALANEFFGLDNQLDSTLCADGPAPLTPVGAASKPPTTSKSNGADSLREAGGTEK